MELKDLVGEYKLKGVDMGEYTITEDDGYFNKGEIANCIRFKLDDVVYVCKEDPDDGYRSSMRDLEVLKGIKLTNEFRAIKVTAVYRDDILEIIDVKTGKVVLRVGTDDTDDYYPCFVCEYHPENMIVNVKR